MRKLENERGEHVEPLRVLHIIGSLNMGGAETWLMQLLRKWSDSRAVQCDFLLTSGKDGMFDAEALAMGARLHRIPYSRKTIRHFATEFRRLLAREHYDAIHDHCDYASGMHFVFGLGMLPRVRIAHVHNPWVHISGVYAVTPIRKISVRLGKQLVDSFATHVCGTSAEILVQYGFEANRVGGPIVRVAHCGFEISDFNQPREGDRVAVLEELGWPPQTKFVICVGRIEETMTFDHPKNHKNTWFALNVAAAAMRKDQDVRLIMVGAAVDGRKELLQAATHPWGLSDRIRFLGVRRDVAKLYRAADILLFPSRQEGLGMAAVEAQAAGLPVLASATVPLEAKVVPELYHAMDLEETIENWGQKVIDILEMPRPPRSLCHELLKQSGFSIENSARTLEEIYASGRMHS